MYCYENKVKILLVNISTNINKTNNYLWVQIIAHINEDHAYMSILLVVVGDLTPLSTIF